MLSPRLAFACRPIAAAVFSLVAAVSHAAPMVIDLPAQALATSIQQLSRLSGLSIGGDASLLAGKTAPAVKGNLEPADALRKLLEGSGLTGCPKTPRCLRLFAAGGEKFPLPSPCCASKLYFSRF